MSQSVGVHEFVNEYVLFFNYSLLLDPLLIWIVCKFWLADWLHDLFVCMSDVIQGSLKNQRDKTQMTSTQVIPKVSQYTVWFMKNSAFQNMQKENENERFGEGQITNIIQVKYFWSYFTIFYWSGVCSPVLTYGTYYL